jgi:hypothetical protein
MKKLLFICCLLYAGTIFAQKSIKFKDLKLGKVVIKPVEKGTWKKNYNYVSYFDGQGKALLTINEYVSGSGDVEELSGTMLLYRRYVIDAKTNELIFIFDTKTSVGRYNYYDKQDHTYVPVYAVQEKDGKKQIVKVYEFNRKNFSMDTDFIVQAQYSPIVSSFDKDEISEAIKANGQVAMAVLREFTDNISGKYESKREYLKLLDKDGKDLTETILDKVKKQEEMKAVANSETLLKKYGETIKIKLVTGKESKKILAEPCQDCKWKINDDKLLVYQDKNGKTIKQTGLVAKSLLSDGQYADESTRTPKRMILVSAVTNPETIGVLDVKMNEIIYTSNTKFVDIKSLESSRFKDKRSQEEQRKDVIVILYYDEKGERYAKLLNGIGKEISTNDKILVHKIESNPTIQNDFVAYTNVFDAPNAPVKAFARKEFLKYDSGRALYRIRVFDNEGKEIPIPETQNFGKFTLKNNSQLYLNDELVDYHKNVEYYKFFPEYDLLITQPTQEGQVLEEDRGKITFYLFDTQTGKEVTYFKENGKNMNLDVFLHKNSFLNKFLKTTESDCFVPSEEECSEMSYEERKEFEKRAPKYKCFGVYELKSKEYLFGCKEIQTTSGVWVVNNPACEDIERAYYLYDANNKKRLTARHFKMTLKKDAAGKQYIEAQKDKGGAITKYNTQGQQIP